MSESSETYIFPASFSQKRLWLLDKINPQQKDYNITRNLRLTGRLDTAALGNAINEVLRRHEVLRTVIAEIDGEPAQIVKPFAAQNLEIKDLREISSERREDELLNHLSKEANRLFDLKTDSLIRFKLFRLAQDEFALALNLHHIVADGWSMGILVNEISVLYQAFSKGENSQLDDLPIQYGDFAVWQKERQVGADFVQSLDYWKKRLAGSDNLSDLPTDFLRPAVQTFRGAFAQFRIDARDTEQIKKFCSAENFSPFMFLAAVFNVFLCRITGDCDISIGTPTANRTRTELENLIGFFVNTLVLRVKFSRNETFLELLEKVRETALDAFDNQEVPFEQVVEAVQPERDLSRSPLFQTMFVFQNAPPGEFKAANLTLREIAVPHNAAKFDLTLQAIENESEMFCGFEYNTDLFKPETVEGFIGIFAMLLRETIENPQAKIGELEILTGTQKKKILAASTGAKLEPEAVVDVVELFERRALEQPGKIVVTDRNSSLTYAELNQRAETLAQVLLANGAAPETRIAVCAERSTDFVVGLLAVMKAGAAYIPLDPTYPAERLRYILKDSRAAILLTQKHLLDKLPTDGAKSILLGEIKTSGQVTAKLKTEFPPSNAAYLIYTSGSTGRPKGVVVSRGNLAYSTAARFVCYERKVGAYLLLSPFAFDSSVAGIFWTLAQGGTLVLPPDNFHEDLQSLTALIAEKKITHLLCLPSVYGLILQIADNGELQSLQTMIVAGEPCPPKLVGVHFKNLPQTKLFNEYGPTENTVWSSVYQCVETSRNFSHIPIGKAIAETENLVLDESLNLVPNGVWGELFLGGKGVARGYTGNSSLTAEKFIPHPFSAETTARLYRTGDKARYSGDGNLEFGGRFDEQIKLRGFRIELGEIERNLERFEAVAEAVAVVQGDGNDKRLSAFLTTTANQKIEIGKLREFLHDFLPDYMIPSRFQVLEKIPHTANGKIDRRRIAELEIENAESEYAAPGDLVEEILANIWAAALQREKIGITDNFFHVGGHSLLAGRIASEIRKSFGLEISLRSIFEHPTIRTLAKQIKNYAKNAEKLVKLSRPDELPLSFAQSRLWFLAQLGDETSAYNVPSVLRLRGALNADALEKSLNNLIERHEILRTVYALRNGEPVQIVHENAELRIERKSILKTAENLQELIAAEVGKPFSLENEIPLRACLVETSAGESYLILTVHHIATDGQSMPILTAELTAFYEAETSGTAAELAPLEWQYADYAVWQKAHYAEEKKRDELEFWREFLAGAPDVLDLPADFSRPAVQTYQGAVCEFELPAESIAAVEKTCRAEQVTPSILLLAVFNILLYRFSRQTDIVMGITFSERRHEEFRPLVGFFVNTLALRTNVGENQSFRDLLRQIKQGALAVYAHGDTPFEMLAQELNPARNLSYAPLFQVMFSLQHESVKVYDAADLSIETVAFPQKTAKFDLSLSLLMNGETAFGAFEYNTDLFRRETVESLSETFQALVKNLLDAPEKLISEISLFADEKALDSLLKKGLGEKVEREASATIVDLFSKTARENPHRIAVEEDNSAISYDELDGFSSGLAENLSKEFDIKAEKVVGLLLNRSANAVKAMLSVLKTGAAYLPLDASYPVERLAFMANEARLSAVICDEANGDLAASLNPTVPIIVIDKFRNGKSAFRVPIDEENPAYLVYTSGTTGQPKAVAATHKNLFSLSRTIAQKYELAADDRVLWFSSISFDVAAEEIFPTLTSGGAIVVRTDEMLSSSRDFWRIVREKKVSVLNLPASFWEQSFTQAMGEEVSPSESLRLMIVGSERLAAGAVGKWHAFADRRIKLFNAYGPTETTVTATLHEIFNQQAEARTPIGTAIENVETFVLDSSLNPLPFGFVGELYIGGAGVMRGYHEKPALTAENLIPHPFSEAGARLYRTGDLARMLPGGAIDLLGRVDRQVKIRGFRVETSEIEAQIKKSPEIRDAVVIAKNTENEEQLVAYFVTDTENFEVENLRREMRKALPNYMIPIFVRLSEIPRLPNGKVDFRALSGLQVKPEKRAVLLPENNLERGIAAVWREVLKTESFGVTDNFFDLGGHSLLLLKVSAALSSKLGATLAIVDLFRYPTIRTLAEFLSESKNKENDVSRTATDRAAHRRKMLSRRTMGGR